MRLSWQFIKGVIIKQAFIINKVFLKELLETTMKAEIYNIILNTSIGLLGGLYFSYISDRKSFDDNLSPAEMQEKERQITIRTLEAQTRGEVNRPDIEIPEDIKGFYEDPNFNLSRYIKNYENFCCPISKKMLRDPVDMFRVNYERKNINQHYLKGEKCCPNEGIRDISKYHHTLFCMSDPYYLPTNQKLLDELYIILRKIKQGEITLRSYTEEILSFLFSRVDNNSRAL